MRYRMGDLVELVTETNYDLKYGLDDIIGVTLEKQIIPTIANLTQTDLDDFIIVHPKDFVYNPRTHGKKIGLGFNTTDRCFISTWNNNTFRVKPNMLDIIIPEYLYMHFLRERWDKEACFNAWGSSTVVLLWSSFCDMKINVPPIPDQRKIVYDYQVITGRIELLRKINENLEEQIIAVFNDFVERFVDDCEEVTLGRITSLICRGVAPDYDETSSEIVLNQKCIRDHMIDFALSRTHIPKTVSDKWVKRGDLLINSTGAGTLGRTALVLFDMSNVTVDSHVSIVRPENPNMAYYLGVWAMIHEAEIEGLQEGSTGQTELPRERLINMLLKVPNDILLKRFNEIVSPYLEMRLNYQHEADALKRLVDRLISSVGLQKGA